jgi:hypothetical protein
MLREVGPERLNSPFCLHLLEEGVNGIEADDDHDRDYHGGDSGQPGQANSRSQQQGQRMGDLPANPRQG